MTEDVVARFESLAIDRCELTLFDARLGSRVILELVKVMATDTDKEAAVFQLQFNRVHFCKVSLMGDPWPSVITGYRASQDVSPPQIVGAGDLTAVKPSTDVYHFVVEFGTDHIDVVAEEFSMQLIKRVPRATGARGK